MQSKCKNNIKLHIQIAFPGLHGQLISVTYPRRTPQRHSRPQSLHFGHVVGETEGPSSSNYRMSVNHGHPVTYV